MKLSDHSRSSGDLLVWLTLIAIIVSAMISAFERMIIEAVRGLDSENFDRV